MSKYILTLCFFALVLLQGCAPAIDLSSKQFPKQYSLEGDVPQQSELCMMGYKAVWSGTSFIYVPTNRNQCTKWIPERNYLINQTKGE